MSRRNDRRGEEIVAALLIGLSFLRRLAGQSGRAARPLRRRASPGPFATVMLLVAAFMALGVFMSLLAGLAALVQSPASAALCALPLAAVALLVWATRRNAGASQADATPPDEQQRTAPVLDTRAQTATPPAAAAAAPRERSLEEEYPRKGLRPPGEYRQRAVSYRRRIESLLKKRRPGPLAERIRSVLERLMSWEERVGQLADRLALFETDDLIQRDLREVPHHIDRLRRQAPLEADVEMREQMNRTLAAYEEQLRQLRLLARVMRRTRYNLDDTLAAMGTVYSQVQVLNAMDIDAPAAARIDDEIGREVDRLNDLMTALGEVYAASSAAADPQPTTDQDEDAGLNGRKARLGRSASS